MDREFTWNQGRMDDAQAIKAKIDALKQERAQLVAQLGDEYSDERLGAQMLRAGDDGAMYKFLRGQQDQLKMNAADKASKENYTQADVDKTLETLYATQAALRDPTKPNEKEQQLLDLYEGQIERMKALNPNLDYSKFVKSGAKKNTVENEGGNELWQLEREFALNPNLTDDEIDEKVNEGIKKHPGYTSQYQKVAEDAKKRSDTAYAEYTSGIDQKNRMIKELYNAYINANDTGTRQTLNGLIKLLGGKINSKGNAVYLNKKSKKDWVKGK